MLLVPTGSQQPNSPCSQDPSLQPAESFFSGRFRGFCVARWYSPLPAKPGMLMPSLQVRAAPEVPQSRCSVLQWESRFPGEGRAPGLRGKHHRGLGAQVSRWTQPPQPPPRQPWHSRSSPCPGALAAPPNCGAAVRLLPAGGEQAPGLVPVTLLMMLTPSCNSSPRVQDGPMAFSQPVA